MGEYTTTEILILAKTYPVPSTKYRETACVAGVTRQGTLLRLFPVPFRFLDKKQQFRKWQWIKAAITKASRDKRPESHRLDIDRVECSDDIIDTTNQWEKRRLWIEPHVVSDPSTLENRRIATGQTLGIIRVEELVGLEIEPEKNPDWDEKEWKNLIQDQFFDSQAARNRPPLRKVPFKFYYRYRCKVGDGLEEFRHLITDWEIGALYWSCVKKYDEKWEFYLRKKLEEDFAKKDLFFLMGTVHRFPNTWLIIGMVYPPKQQTQQLLLGLSDA